MFMQFPPLVYAIPPLSRQALALPGWVMIDVLTAPLSSRAVKGYLSLHVQAGAGNGAEHGTKHALTHSVAQPETMQ